MDEPKDNIELQMPMNALILKPNSGQIKNDPLQWDYATFLILSFSHS